MKERNLEGFCAEGIREIKGLSAIVSHARDANEARRLVAEVLTESISTQEKVLYYAARLILWIHRPKF